MIELPLAIKAVVARFAVCRSFTKRKNVLRHARNVHEVLVEVKKPMNCYGCGVGLSSLEKYVEHQIEEHKFATEYVQQPFHNDKAIHNSWMVRALEHERCLHARCRSR
ncbi:hypothetical protein MTO96_045248, partial [Rhipicephalus appendiculatus]